MTSLGFDNKLICAALRCLFYPLSLFLYLFLFACGSFRCLSSLFMNMQLVCKLKCYAALVLLYLLLTLNDFKYEYSISMFVTAALLLYAFFVVGPKPNLWGPSPPYWSSFPCLGLKVGYGIAVEMPESQTRHELVMFHGVMSECFLWIFS